MAELDEIECRFLSEQWNSQFANDFELTADLFCPRFYWPETQSAEFESSRATNLLSPELIPNFRYISAGLKPNNRPSNERICLQVWLSVDIMTGSVFIIFDVGWGGLLLFLSVCV